MPILARSDRQARQIALLGAGLIVLSLLLLQIQSNRHELGLVRSATLSLLLPIAEAGTVVQRSVGDVWAGFMQTSRVREENEHLREELARLHIRSATAQSRIAELDSSALLNQHLPEFSARMRAVPVVGPVIDGRRRRLWISMGDEDGVQAGMTVLGPRGVIGRIREVHGRHSLVQLISDEDSRWGGEVVARQESGVLEGTGGRNAVEFRLEKTTTAIEPGDTVLTSGRAGSVVPAGLPLGEVTEIGVDESGERRAVLRLPDDPERLRQVYVLDSHQLPWEPGS